MDWKKSLKWSDQQINDIRFVGYSYLQQGKYEIASKFFEALTVFDPDNAYDLQVLGALYLEMNNTLDALAYLDKALKLQSDHLPSQLNRAKALFNLGHKKQGLIAVKNLTKSPDESIKNEANALIFAYS